MDGSILFSNSDISGFNIACNYSTDDHIHEDLNGV